MISISGISVIDLVLTARCNLACSYCYQNRRNSLPMQPETLLSAVDLLFRSERNPVWLSFYGGEPLLEFGMVELAVEEVERRNREGVRFAISTNGLLLRQREAAFLAQHGFLTQISFDGIDPAQALRGEGTFSILDRRLDDLQKTHPVFFREDVSVAISTTPDTVEHLAASVRYFLEKQVCRIQISPVETCVLNWHPARISELEAQFAQISRLSQSHCEESGRVPVTWFQEDDEQELSGPREGAMCGVATGESLTVDTDGSVFGCVMFAESYQSFPGDFLLPRLRRMRLGGLREPGFQKRLAAFPAAVEAAEIFNHKEKKYSSYGRCRDCAFFFSCDLCPVSIGYIPGNTDPHRVPDFACAFYRVASKYGRAFRTRDAVRGSRQVSSPQLPEERPVGITSRSPTR